MATKKTVAAKIPSGRPKVKVVQTVDRVLNEATVYFTDGTHMPVKSDTLDLDTLSNPDYLAPNSVRVWTERGKIAHMEPLDKPAE